ncbi:transcription factor Adf-1-like [Dermacentor silvarum]|uniref:transcription factor Adf-1-like n=1 Tax=Dermacentor silvarum TaxID=543639 RepID=UPI0021007F8C|nr:transcription factor Adf-1-like [Dermacentor silvarum]
MAACGARSESAAVVFTTSVDDDSASEDALIERLLEGIRSHPCVYDVKRMDYRDTERKNNAWEAIRKQCGLATVDQCLKLWKRLRDRFNRERKLIEQTKRSGSGYVAKRTWEFLSAMEFYKDCGRMRPTVSNVRASQEGATSQDSTAEELLNTMCGTASVSPLPSEDSFDQEQAGQADQYSVEPVSLQADRRTCVGTVPSSVPKKRKKNDDFDQQLLSHLKEKMTENEAFGLSIGLTLDRLAKQVAAKCKARLMEVIAEFDI